MGTLSKVTRRTFLVGSVAVAGGVAFGFYAYKTPGDNPLLADLGEGEAALTPYVLISPDAITLITPRADKGQGAYSVQALLIAEELDVELDQIRVDPGPPSPVYYNTALATEAVPFRSTDTSNAANAMRGVADAAMKFIGMQITGGSTTVPDSYEKLRIAGAIARETLKKAASKETGTPIADLRTERGHVILPDGTERSYQSLAEAASGLTVVSDVELRDPAQWRLIGKPVQRVDIIAKSTGTQDYGIDLKFDDMLYAAVRRNPRNGGGMAGYDASTAETMRGVHSVIDLGDGIGVIADNTWRAFQAADAVECEWEAAPFPANMDEHWQVLSDSFTEENLNSRNLDAGDVVTALSEGDVLEAEYRAPYLAHSPLEPVNAVVKVTDARVDIWTGTQVPRFVQTNVAAITGHAPEDIHVHVLMMGGSFGHRLEDNYIHHAVRLAMTVKGRPVKLTYKREEDFSHDYLRQISMGRMRGNVSNGQVESYDLSVTMPSVTDSQMGRQGLSLGSTDPIIATGAWDQPYAIPNYRVSAYKAPPLAPLSSWRSVGASTNAFLHEGFLDELIHAAGADPLEERLRLMNDETSRRVLEAVGDMSDWGSDLGPGRGRGVAFALSFGTPVAEVVEVTDTPAGIQIDRVFVAADVGKVVDPVNFDNLVKGGVVFGLGHAMNCEITFTDGMVDQPNFYAFEGMKFYQCPEILVRGLENGSRIRGIGEPPVPPAGPALGNAIFAATGQRLCEMPFSKFVRFA
ncbi:molybdopterin cofactor-binding domain-containing protein [Ponticaulis sp.]|uniref:xanthine dehydrogenase family protein molybdopterin-binding subunit n=1 Tax=Ponticaulis sp. TaxID=2020902 RepID=UPI000B709346|nr:molybdopterin cofactor-binding domain-containing protein [Ponticaulis sp.]MAI90913.1 isoquinoline 1-oxidoreductase [Ponticaulis sp.]OUX98257.1 MAG: isoquinoline 1-oxidoreductase [Hyphomonadaceae bacterium TMED5]|tara:strand:- start:18429 stop:20669 length:2241 start_codon:yes stop_codon:yes gene_type:complete